MKTNQSTGKKRMSQAANLLFLGLLLLLVFHPGSKAWLLQQLMRIGLFQPEIKKEAVAAKAATGNTSFLFRNETGEVLSTASLKGKVVFINFWATWCPPCLAEMPALNDLYNRFRKDGRFVFLFVNEDDDTAKASAYLQSKGYSLPLVTRAGTSPAEIYSGTLPTTIVLNKEGRIVFKHEGLAKYNSTSFMDQLKALL